MAGNKEDEQVIRNNRNESRLTDHYDTQKGITVQKIGLTEILASRLGYEMGNVPLPRTRTISEWQEFLERTGKRTDLLKLPFRYPEFSATYLVANRRTARNLLLRDFDDIDMFRGEREFFAAFQGGIIFRQNSRQGWKDSRKEISSYMSPKAIDSHDGLISKAVAESTDEVVGDIEEGSVPTSKIFRRFVAQTLFRTHLGHSVPQEKIDQLVDSFQAFYKVAPSIVLGIDRIRPVHDYVNNKLQPYTCVIEEAVFKAFLDENPSLLGDFLKQNSDDEVEWFHTVFAGQSSLATSLEWITYNLATDKQAQDDLRDGRHECDYPNRVGEFLESTASKFPTPTFLLRKTNTPISTSSGHIPDKALLVVPLFGLPSNPDNRPLNGIPHDGMYDLQFSPGLRRCLGRYLCESIHRNYITSLIDSSKSIDCENNPTATIGMTVVRPNEEFQFSVTR